MTVRPRIAIVFLFWTLLFEVEFAGPLRSQNLDSLSLLKNYTAERISSYDRTGANADGDHAHPIQPGETRTIGEVQGPGIITHMWMTAFSTEVYHLKKFVLRIYWDGDASPAVDAPLGDFFGLGLGEYFTWESAPIVVGSQKALNCFFRCHSGSRPS